MAQAHSYRLLKQLTDSSLQPYGLTSLEWFMIGSIYDAGSDGISVTDLSAAMGTNVPYVTNATTKLVDRAIVRRTVLKDNARSKRLSIEPSYVPTIVAIEESVRTVLRRDLYAAIDPGDLLTYVSVLYKIVGQLG